ncbi:hypothetical protein F5I97DRAFT_1829115 [Phlebopus sp. FC_14]|nr:hypothetical protein F5I97DRAFT_1829115 [Phlebopus sp. FC_14]
MKLFTLTFRLLAGSAVVFASNTSSGCLCTSDDPCWPSASTFAQLQSQVSQPLIYPHPTAYACYPVSNPSGNCTEVEENYMNGNWRSSMPGSMDTPYFETFIFANGTGTCSQGSVPVIGVDARSPADIQAAVNFAVKYNLKLVVKNTGHDYLGRSTARGSFVVWTHNMKNITYSPAFVPLGAPANETDDAVTLSAGVEWQEAYGTVNQYGRMMVGGISAGGSIGAAGGWLAGGGHSILSPNYGLGVDNAIEMTVVLSTGDHVTANEHQFSDLFWALRGGGGATYGIVTSVTYHTYPSLPVQMYSCQANFTNATAMEESVAELMHSQIQFTDDGWGGYGAMSNSSLYFILVGPNMSAEAANAGTRAWTEYAQSLEQYGVSSEAGIVGYPSWYDWYMSLPSFFSAGASDGLNIMFTSRLLSRDTLENKYKNVTKMLLDCGASFNMIAGGKVNQVDPDSAGLNPAWRNAIVEAVCGFSWEDGTSHEDLQVQIKQLKSWINAMHDLTPSDGAYFNEVCGQTCRAFFVG